MKKFCPKCGVSIERGIFCSTCEQKDLEYKQIKIKLCPSNRYFSHGKWTTFKNLRSLTEKLLHESFKKKVKVIRGLELHEDILLKPGLSKELQTIISVDQEEYVIPINVEVTYSPGVSKLGSSYFEGILQLRNATDEVKDYIRRVIAKNKDRNMFVNNTTEKKDAADYYFVNKHHINVVALKVIRNFGGYMIQSPKLFSRNKQTSKDIYRLNVQLTVPKFKVGDIVSVNDNTILVRKTSKDISGFDLAKKKHSTFRFNEKNADKIEVIKKQKTTISRTKPELRILNPETYQEEQAINPLNLKLKSGQKVIIVKNKNKFYIIK